MKAQDVGATYNEIITGDRPPVGVLGGIDSAEVVDDLTVQDLQNPNADFAITQVRIWASIVPKDVIDNDLDALQTEEFGNGPFNLESYPNNTQLVMTKNPEYYRSDSGSTQYPYVD